MPVMKFSQIRSGLWAGEHRRRMGEAIWLYGWLQSRVDRQTGVVGRYTHGEAATELEAPERSVRRWLGTLKAERYVEVEQHRYELTVRITNYRPNPDRPDLATLKSETGQICPPDRPDLSARPATDGHPLIHTDPEYPEYSETTVVVTTNGADPASLPPPSHCPELADITESEKDWLRLLKAIPDYPLRISRDLPLLRKLVEQHGQVAVARGLDEYRDSPRRIRPGDPNQVKRFVAQAARWQVVDASRAAPATEQRANAQAYKRVYE
jgi:hypothetical protein